MTGACAEFFNGLSIDDDFRLHKATGSVRFDLANDHESEHWLVTMDKGSVTAARASEASDCDCIVRSDRAFFERVLRGEENTTTAVLRGVMSIEGDYELLFLFQRLLPARPVGERAARS